MKIQLTYLLMFTAVLAFSQEKDKKYLPKGNAEFKDKDYKSAEANYRIAGSRATDPSEADYNLGNAIYRQGQNVEAGYAYVTAVKNSQDKTVKYRAYHNLGNVLMKEKDYQHAVEAYKNALRNNPYDEETRYNYALAKKMLKDNPPPPQPPQDQQNDKDKQDKNQQPKDQNNGGGGENKDKGDKGDQKDKDNTNDKGDQKDNTNDKGDQKDKTDGKDRESKAGEGGDQEQDGPTPGKQRMENLLDAMNNEERKVQEKVNAKKVKVQPRQPEKDW